MKHMLLIATITLFVFAQTVFAEQKLFLGSTFDSHGDSTNGKIVTVEAIVDDEAIGSVAYLLIREIQAGNIVSSYTITVREGNTLSIPFNSKILGIGESGTIKKNWKITGIDSEGVTAEIVADILPQEKIDPNKI